MRRTTMFPYHFSFILVLLLWTPDVYGVDVTNIRLVNVFNPSNTREGRLEIQRDNVDVWGSVCDDKFDNLDAFVACRMLGFNNGGEAVLDGSLGTDSSLAFFLDEAGCDGGEAHLRDCRASQDIDCNLNVDTQVGIRCNANTGQTQAPPTTTTVRPVIIPGNCERITPTVRLYGANPANAMGLVEVQNPRTGVWGFVCDDDWDENAARVVCAQLCYPTNFTARPGVPAEYLVTPPNPQIILDNVICQGNEATLQDCAHSAWGQNDCLQGAGELAGVQCVEAPYQPPPPPIPILTCAQGKMIAEFSRILDPNLEEKHLSVYPIPCLDVEKATTDRTVSITIPVDKCGTVIQRNDTFIQYTNTIKYDYTSQEEFITRANTYIISLDCSIPVTVEVTARVQPMTETVTQSAIGAFRISLEIYKNDSFETPETDNPVQIPMGSFINMAVVLEQTDPRLKIVVPTCIATPNGDLTARTRKVLFENKCVVEPTLSFYPISNFKFGFRFRTFRFANVNLLYVHCEAVVCLASSTTQQCDRTCNNNKPNVRRRRSADMYLSTEVMQSIYIVDPFTVPNKNLNDLNDPDFQIIINAGATTPRITTTRSSTTTKSASTNSTTPKKGDSLLKPVTLSPSSSNGNFIVTDNKEGGDIEQVDSKENLIVTENKEDGDNVKVESQDVETISNPNAASRSFCISPFFIVLLVSCKLLFL